MTSRGKFWMVWAVINPGEAHTLMSEKVSVCRSKSLVGSFGIVAPSNARLIGNNNKFIPSILQQPHTLDCAWKKFKVFPSAHVAMIHIDDAIPI
jgi:hypothetical protein